MILLKFFILHITMFRTSSFRLMFKKRFVDRYERTDSELFHSSKHYGVQLYGMQFVNSVKSIVSSAFNKIFYVTESSSSSRVHEKYYGKEPEIDLDLHYKFEPILDLVDSNSERFFTNDNDLHSPLLISIEGNIGAGKTTLLNELRAKHTDWVFVNEYFDANEPKN